MAEKTLSKLLPVAIARPAATRTFEAWYAPIKGKARRYVPSAILNDEVLAEGSRSCSSSWIVSPARPTVIG